MRSNFLRYDAPPLVCMVQADNPERIKELIQQAHDDMIRAAKSLDYLAAARYRDQMRELEKLLK